MYPLTAIPTIGAFVLAILYGLYVATLVHCLRWLIYTDDGWKQRDRINKFMLTATILIFILSTINLGDAFQYALFIMGVEKWGPAQTILIDVPESAALLIVDGVLIYRCWTVYANSWRSVCLPIIFWVGSLTCTVLNVFFDYVMTVAPDKNAKLLSHIQSGDVLSGLYACNIATNLYSTSAIIYKIMSVTKTAGGDGIRPKRFRNTVRILAESGIVYTLMTVFSLIGVTLDANWAPAECKGCLIMAISDAMIISTAGITFNLILIRVNQDRARVTDTYVDTTHMGDANKKTMLSRLRFRTTNHSTNTNTSTHLSSNLSSEQNREEILSQETEN